jgi:hypothetical protein
MTWWLVVAKLIPSSRTDLDDDKKMANFMNIWEKRAHKQSVVNYDTG